MFAYARVWGLSAVGLLSAACSSSVLPDFARGGPDARRDASASHEAGAEADATFLQDAGRPTEHKTDGGTSEDAEVVDAAELADAAGRADAGVRADGGPLMEQECSPETFVRACPRD